MARNDEFIPTRRSLLTRLKNWEDQEGWREFFDTYWRLIHTVALKAGFQDAEAQDIVQDTFVAVAKKMRNFKYDPKIGSFKAWLLLNTRSRIAERLRKKRLPIAEKSPQKWHCAVGKQGHWQIALQFEAVQAHESDTTRARLKSAVIVSSASIPSEPVSRTRAGAKIERVGLDADAVELAPQVKHLARLRPEIGTGSVVQPEAARGSDAKLALGARTEFVGTTIPNEAAAMQRSSPVSRSEAERRWHGCRSPPKTVAPSSSTILPIPPTTVDP